MLISIEYLADQPELVPLLSTWFFNEWGRNNPALTVKVIEERVKQRLNRDKPPLCLVAFVENQPVATAALKIREMETHPQYVHWLRNVYVLPEYRAQGIGTAVIERAKDEAKRIGIRDLYLYTRDRVSLYTRLGWQTIEQATYRGRTATIMRQGLL
jgi:N-acetylglutamate synthase-like GNAT family acetyltransferase